MMTTATGIHRMSWKGFYEEDDELEAGREGSEDPADDRGDDRSKHVDGEDGATNAGSAGTAAGAAAGAAPAQSARARALAALKLRDIEIVIATDQCYTGNPRLVVTLHRCLQHLVNAEPTTSGRPRVAYLVGPSKKREGIDHLDRLLKQDSSLNISRQLWLEDGSPTASEDDSKYRLYVIRAGNGGPARHFAPGTDSLTRGKA